MRQFDSSMLDRAAACDPDGWFRTAASVGNRLRVCGLAATYTMLHAIGPAKGRLLNYKQAIDDRAHLLRELRQHGVSRLRRPFDPGRSPCLNPRLTLLPAAAPEAEHRRAPHPLAYATRSLATTPQAEAGRWDGPRYRMTYRSRATVRPSSSSPASPRPTRSTRSCSISSSTRFRTIIYDYPGEQPDDGAKLNRITHDNLVDDLFGLIDHLNIGRAFLAGLSFGSTVVLKALHREPRRFPKAAVQGAFAHRQFSVAERLAFPAGADCSRERPSGCRSAARF